MRPIVGKKKRFSAVCPQLKNPQRRRERRFNPKNNLSKGKTEQSELTAEEANKLSSQPQTEGTNF